MAEASQQVEPAAILRLTDSMTTDVCYYRLLPLELPDPDSQRGRWQLDHEVLRTIADMEEIPEWKEHSVRFYRPHAGTSLYVGVPEEMDPNQIAQIAAKHLGIVERECGMTEPEQGESDDLGS